jgi:hypothetical protein
MGYRFIAAGGTCSLLPTRINGKIEQPGFPLSREEESTYPFGSVTVNVVPSPSLLVTSMVPP